MSDTTPQKELQSPAERELARRSRRAFLTLGVGAIAGIAGWRWLWGGGGEDSDELPPRVKRILDFNGRSSSRLLYKTDHLAQGFPVSEAKMPKVNGEEGIADEANLDEWRLKITPYGKQSATMDLDLAAVRRLPRVEHVTELKCIEGWSTVVHWAGVRFSDFTRAFVPSGEKAQYVGMQTPDGEYYVGVDMPSALHEQTLLCYEMNGAPLPQKHGAPLRLVIPVKYGIKNLKRIGSIVYTDKRPADYWAEQGYDYFAGL
jgi:hypothetical protein